ncbi:MAG: hypothetical protein QGG36_18265 [Pirellulaceae bacterium]|jgi:hypothetical protein|nr:hypothetical protein [Pirellulaceae bacterium]MDP7017755.1 hypothetical protein [Pirellulaceae bacterium]
MTIRLRIDPVTGKKDIVITLSSDADSLPHEHEQQHRELVDKVIEGGLVAAAEIGKVIVEREEEESTAAPEAAPPAEERRSQAEGS